MSGCPVCARRGQERKGGRPQTAGTVRSLARPCSLLASTPLCCDIVIEIVVILITPPVSSLYIACGSYLSVSVRDGPRHQPPVPGREDHAFENIQLHVLEGAMVSTHAVEVLA